ncbi:MAG: DUF1343 domain-containing protein [Candidatus Eremiobacteraeota bacterium]|nr:DUF1343 domain-containing protein [Candidatus Eremiobacteraeota bacterium]
MTSWFPGGYAAESQTPGERMPSDGQPVINGIDVLQRDGFHPLRDKRVGIVAHAASVTVEGRRSVDALAASGSVDLRKIFSPEHGLSATADTRIGDSVDRQTGLPVISLYGETLKPTAEQLHDLDVVLYDLQDIGCRFYTYITTLGWLLEAAAEQRVSVFVLDRPNPIGGGDVEGPCSDVAHESLVAYHELPLRHGMTVGELARLFNAERRLHADLRVVTMGGWQRGFLHSDTHQRWINPSPNIRDEIAALLFPGVGLIEGTNVSVGRGTDTPFHVMGAPWLDGAQLSAALDMLGLPALRTEPLRFTPKDPGHRFCGEACQGVRFTIEDPRAFSPAALGLGLVQTLRALYPTQWQHRLLDPLLASTDLLHAIEEQSTALPELWEPGLEFFEARARALLY